MLAADDVLPDLRFRTLCHKEKRFQTCMKHSRSESDLAPLFHHTAFLQSTSQKGRMRKLRTMKASIWAGVYLQWGVQSGEAHDLRMVLAFDRLRKLAPDDLLQLLLGKHQLLDLTETKSPFFI